MGCSLETYRIRIGTFGNTFKGKEIGKSRNIKKRKVRFEALPTGVPVASMYQEGLHHHPALPTALPPALPQAIPPVLTLASMYQEGLLLRPAIPLV